MTQNAYDTGNIFAKIIRGEIPSIKVFENEDVLAIMDVMPQADGHVLVLPKAPCRNLLDADPAVLSHVLPVVQKIAVAVKDAFDADGISIFQYNEAAGGQSVFHLHFHIVPRHSGMGMRAHSGKMEDGAVLRAHADRILAELG
jgi:histidine triad (HIT) family protein